MGNVAYIFLTKHKNPFNSEWDYSHLVPAVRDLQGNMYNYVVVCCEPSNNGVYKYPAENRFKYRVWNNGKLPCYYIPISDCEKIKELEDITNEDTRNTIRNLQMKWWKGEVKNGRAHKSEKPSWLIS